MNCSITDIFPFDVFMNYSVIHVFVQNHDLLSGTDIVP